MAVVTTLDRDWEFRRCELSATGNNWAPATLPHNPFVADLDGREHWFGICEYRRTLLAPLSHAGERHVLHVGGAMHTATVFVDDRELARHEGGYLPFEVDLTAALADGAAHRLLLRLDNREDDDVPPGKPYGELDFCWYGGLYRGVELRTLPALHITEAISAGEVGGGGVFLRTLAADVSRAVVAAKVHVRNTDATPRCFRVQAELLRDGHVVSTVLSGQRTLAPGLAVSVEQELTLTRPALWSPAAPHLHEAVVTVLEGERVVDERRFRYGVRRIGFGRADGFTVNGARLRLRGTNRHQEFPRVGYAAPRAAQYRDARRIKEAGFDYVRLSHYPQSPDFLDACDELGLVVMNAIPGWQFCGGEKFQAACVENARQLVRRDRNHACVVLWELSLNETQMPASLMERLHAAGHEECPGDQMFTCGWIDRFDVFIHSRQHGQIHTWRNADRALVIAEYGDWEFYAANEGFDQTTGAGVLAAWANSRHLRGEGERALRQQAQNHILALDDTLASPAVLDGQWTVFDYARGYHPQRAACGVMDIFRLPKFSYHFYRSQRDATEGGIGWTGGAVVFIASHWTPASALRVLVFSNCEEVELSLNGRSLGRRKPDRTWQTQHLPHPPFVFDLPRFEPGELAATGFAGARPVVRHTVRTPGAPARMEVVIDSLDVPPGADESDIMMVHASIVDAAGTVCVSAADAVTFTAAGGAAIVGPATVPAEAGIASVVLRVPARCADWSVAASAEFAGDGR
ncbi:MAG: glycoside hydrolase family 2 TIM barrel-domain containing protein [Opitutaceae bacterium]